MTPLCEQVDEAMSELLDGSAPDVLLEHVADCDRCRDARHDAEQARELAIDSGADYQHPEDLEQRLLAAIDEGNRTQHSAEAAASGQPAVTASPVTAKPASDGPPIVRDTSTPTKVEAAKVVRWLRKPRNTLIAGAVGAALAAATVALVMRPGEMPSEQASAHAPWSGKVAKVSRAAGGEGGLEVCDAEAKDCKPLAAGAAVEAGSLLRTDDRTRAYVELGDGTRMALDRSTKLQLDGKSDRRAKLQTGAIVAEVKKHENTKVTIDLPRGHLEVLGTKFAARTMGEAAAVDVSRGAVLLVDEGERSVTVRAGEEGRSYPGVPPYASSAPRLGEALSWSENNEEEQAVVVRGLGELKAKKPGEKDERKGAVKLASHKLDVHIVGGFARTQVEEVFSNTTDEVLEGIFRFPLPPDAQIEGLALEVEGGKLEQGAFVDRDRAAAIWRGAIVNAGGQRQPQEEIVWVPGPWRDPALLEWQRGGRFELHIYPIPKKGSRRVVLTYTQVIQPVAGVRRYVYPLAYDPSGALRVDDFTADVQVRGFDPEMGVRSVGYDMTRGERGKAEALTMTAQSFVPSGDLVVEYADADRDSELTAWAFQPAAVAQPAAGARLSSTQNAPQPLALQTATNKTGGDDAAAEQDSAPYLAMALRPKLPRRTDDTQRAFVLVVDASRSMFGERYRRAGQLAARVVRELDRLDRFTVMACDTTCRSLSGGLRTPSNEAAADVKQWLDNITPEGGSDPAASLRDAAAVASHAEGRELRVVYIGDGTPTVGPIRPADLARASSESIPAGRGTVTTVAIGADADGESLSAMARGGNGVMLPYVPGEKTSEAAYAVLGASYGLGLSDVRLDLPDGLVEVAPKALDTIAHGGESIVVARMTRPQVSGKVVLHGKVGKQDFEQSYQLDVSATSDSGNAFVPRLYAAKRITDLERDGSAEARETAVKLSSEFNVASRYTSLLVLESAAMFKAFGLDNSRTAPSWTGEDDLTGAKAKGDQAVDETKTADSKKSEETRNPWDADGDFFDEGGAEKEKGSGRASGGSGRFFPDSLGSPGGAAGPMATTAPPASEPMAPPAQKSPPRPRPQPQAHAEAKPSMDVPRDDVIAQDRSRRMVPMRRIFERQVHISTTTLVPAKASPDAIAKAEAELAVHPNRREAVKELYTLLALAGQLDRASELAERWSEKEALDPEALTARADLAARQGQRDEAIRILGSVVDVRPGDVAAQKRLARLHRWAGRPALGCRHSIAIAENASQGRRASLRGRAVRPHHRRDAPGGADAARRRRHHAPAGRVALAKRQGRRGQAARRTASRGHLGGRRRSRSGADPSQRSSRVVARCADAGAHFGHRRHQHQQGGPGVLRQSLGRLRRRGGARLGRRSDPRHAQAHRPRRQPIHSVRARRPARHHRHGSGQLPVAARATRRRLALLKERRPEPSRARAVSQPLMAAPSPPGCPVSSSKDGRLRAKQMGCQSSDELN